MGLETILNSSGRLALETSEIIYRSDALRLKISLKDIRSATAEGGSLIIAWSGAQAVFEIGPKAPKWVDKILNPPSLATKLGIKPGLKISIRGDLGSAFKPAPLVPGSDIILFHAATLEDLEEVPKLITSLAPKGALWIIYPKGRKDIRESDVRSAALGAGLVDIKVAAFDKTLTATKWVRRK